MDKHAFDLLIELFEAKERTLVGARIREASLTGTKLRAYRSERSLAAKERFEDTMRTAQQAGAVTLEWDGDGHHGGFLARVTVKDERALAAFVGRPVLSDTLDDVSRKLALWRAAFPVLNDVIAHWAQLKAARTTRPQDVNDWVDAARLVDAARTLTSAGADVAVPIREFSVGLFQDSKRVERLLVPVDALLSGSLETEPRPGEEVWSELGLFREQHPARLAGRIIVRRGRVCALLDEPYTGLPPSTVDAIVGPVEQVLTIENMTPFHVEARRRCDEPVLLLYTAGMPSPGWRAMYRRLLRSLPAGTPVAHWGDIDEGGYRIAATIAADASACGHVLAPWKMHPAAAPHEARVPATPGTLARMQRFANAAGWNDIAEAVLSFGIKAEQEGLLA